MLESDRLFARIAIKKNWVEPGQVEEARTYQEKLAAPGPTRLAMTLAQVLERLGRLNQNQIQAVLKEMEPFSFKCIQCGGKGFHLEHGDENSKCEKCRGASAGAATTPGAPAAPPVIQRIGRPSPLASAKTPAAPAESAPEAPAAPTSADMTKRRARAASYDIGNAGTPPGGVGDPKPDTAKHGGSGERGGAEGGHAASGPNRLGSKPSGLSNTNASRPAAVKPPVDERKPRPTENKTMDISAEEILSATRTSVPHMAPQPAQEPKPSPAPPSRSSGIVADQGHDTAALLKNAETGTARTPPKTATGQTSSIKMRAPSGVQATDPLIGKSIGGCRIEQFLGRGGMGTVYKATQVDLDRTVAFKVLSQQLTADPKQVAQFLREAKALAKLEHPNIVAIYNAAHDKESDIYFIVMQFVAGGSLEGLLKREGPKLPHARAAKLIEQAGRGLLEAHAKGITHRDVKPDNMLIAEGDTLKVTDFGLARMEADAAGFTFAEGRIVGTPYYMSPEQIDGRNVDSRTDIYALGATMYYLLTGQKPFQGDTPVEILLKHVNEELVPPSKRNKEIPESLSQIVVKAMAKEPDRRYQSLRDFLRDLEDAQKGKEVKVEIIKPVEEKKAPEPEQLFSSAGGVTAPVPLAPVAIERPKSFYYSVIGLAAATLIAIGLGLGPIREIMAESSAETVSPRELDAQHARDQLDGSAPKGREKVVKLRKFVEDHAGTQVAEMAARDATFAEDEIKKEATAKGAALMDQAQKARGEGKHGAALEALATFPKELEGFGVEKQLEEAATGIRDDLAKTRQQAYVPAGDFIFGENDGKRTLPLFAYYIDLHEVSNREYAEWVRAGGGKAPADWAGAAPRPGTEDLPVTGVSAREAETYARSKGKRLPTVQEWERAARGPGGLRYPWGDNVAFELANSREGGGVKLEAVTSRPKGASPVGALNMAGNAAEWVVVPAGDARGREQVWVKGGAYESDLVSCRAAFWNDALGRDDADPAVGFRLAQDVER